jgi:CheY-like chemotaxis protein
MAEMAAFNEPAGDLSDRDEGAAVLIVDDSEANRALLRLLLEQGGYDVAEAVDGDAALHAVEARRPRLVLMDIVMPKMDGIEATRRLRHRYDAMTLPIVVMSSNHGSDVLAAVRAAGGNEFLPKPISRTKLQAIVKRYLA